jgi:hypothetical protein
MLLKIGACTLCGGLEVSPSQTHQAAQAQLAQGAPTNTLLGKGTQVHRTPWVQTETGDFDGAGAVGSRSSASHGETDADRGTEGRGSKILSAVVAANQYCPSPFTKYTKGVARPPH